MSDVSVNELKEKFNTLQGISQSLKEDKIRLESELKTLQSDRDELLKSLMEKTGTESFEDAVKYYETHKEDLDKEMSELSETLNTFLDTYGEDGENGI